ncbi:MAG: T9SS type A sorting domain-containing protein [Flavobacteriales bacterium]
MQKRLLQFGIFSLLSFLSFAQESQFMGYFTPTISNLVPATPSQTNSHQQVIKPNFKGKELIQVDQSNTHNPDWVWQQHEATEKTPSATVMWANQGLGTNLSPPDPTLDADSNVVIESTNSSGGAVYRIFNKSTGATIASSLTMQTLGGVAGLGDPIVLYYKPAKRWFLTEFSSSGNKLLIHVSQTSNPQGAYYTYSFTCTSFPDYPKYAFCTASDAFLASTNEGGPPSIYAMKISAMLTGATSPFIKTTIGYSLNGFGFQSITPVDLEGDIAAPAGMKPLFIRHRDDESHSNGSPDSGTNDWLELWEMTINWTASTATVAKIQDVAMAEIDSKLCGLTSFACIKQPGTTNTLDPLREPVMQKAPMRIFDDHQTILAALSTDVDGADRAGVRWVELRRASNVTTATWVNYQEGTYAPGTGTSRWMPAINIDKYGNIIMAYSTSSNNAGDYPSIKMTGRKPCDPLGQMTMPETTIIAGTSSKTGDTRWGDYHHMSIDDFDGVTFYYSGVYQNTQTKSNVSAIRMNPDAVDAAISSIFVPGTGAACGSSTQIGVVVQQTGSSSITSGVLTWQVGSGAVTSVNYTSNQLTSMGSMDTVFITVNGLVSGSNTITVTTTTVNGVSPDENTCNNTKTLTFTVGGGSSITANMTINFAPTCTSNNGQVTLTATGGSAPYTYSINNGTPQTSPVFSNLAPGSYTYTVIENGGCSGTGTFVLPAAAVIVANPTLSNAITCHGNTNASITVAASGGQAAYSYSITGTTYQASNIFTNLAAGTYTVYAQDANGCIGNSTLTITEPAAIGVNAVPTMISCTGANNGQIFVSASGGVAPLTYSINGTNFQSSNSFTGLSAGTYTVTVKDANGCLQTFTTTVTEPAALTLTCTTTVSNGNDGTITVTGAGGNLPYTYSINGTNYYSGSLFSGLAIGVYTVYIKDANGCISSMEVTVNTSGIEELGFTLVQLYPNPNKGVFELEMDGVEGTNVDGKLFNVSGQLVSTFQISATDGKVKQTIEMSKKLAAGTYYLGLYNNNKAVVKQFIKE